MKQKNKRGILSTALFICLAASLSAVGLRSPTVKADDSLLFGQKQAYSAIVRTDQKVVTYAKIFLQNPDEKELKNTSFSVPNGVNITNLSVHQILLPTKCKDKAPTNSNQMTANSPSAYPNNYSSTDCSTLEKNAYEFDQYGYGYYDYSNTGTDSQYIYKQLTLPKSGNTYNLTLPEPIKSQKRGAYIVSYIATTGYVKGSLGLYDLDFKTLQVPQSVEEVRVAVDVASDLYTKEKRSEISSGGASSDAITSQANETKNGSAQSKDLDKLQGSIGSGGSFTKTGKALAPNEVFVVHGSFADAAWKLNLGWIIGSIIGLIVAIGLVVVLLRKAQQQEIRHLERGQESGK